LTGSVGFDARQFFQVSEAGYVEHKWLTLLTILWVGPSGSWDGPTVGLGHLSISMLEKTSGACSRRGKTGGTVIALVPVCTS